MSPETLRQFCGYTTMTGNPMRIDAAGRRWAFATQNQGFLMVPDEGFELSEPAPAIGRSVPVWAESALAAEFEVPFAALRAFVDNGVPLERECPDCIDGTSECPHCEQEMPCDSCGGDRTISRGRDEVLLFGVPFDATLVAYFLRHFEAQSVRVVPPTEGTALFIADANGSWVVGVMPLNERCRANAKRSFPEASA